MRVEEALAEASAALAAGGFDEPRRRARRLVAAALGLPPLAVLAHPERSIAAPDAARLGAMLARLLAHEPLSRILGRREFWGLDFALSRETLDPRPESEALVEAVLARIAHRQAPLRLLDLGAGSGCLLLALLSELPGARGLGVDISPGAAATARGNAGTLGLAGRARFIVGDWGAALGGPFDAIVANPPYIATGALAGLPPEVGLYDPCRALDGGADGLAAYRALAADIPRLLSPGGLFACEIGVGGAGAAAILESAGLVIEGCERDLAGVPRCLLARVAPSMSQTAGRRGGKNRLECAAVPSRVQFLKGSGAPPEGGAARPGGKDPGNAPAGPGSDRIHRD